MKIFLKWKSNLEIRWRCVNMNLGCVTFRLHLIDLKRASTFYRFNLIQNSKRNYLLNRSIISLRQVLFNTKYEELNSTVRFDRYSSNAFARSRCSHSYECTLCTGPFRSKQSQCIAFISKPFGTP